MVTAHMLSQLHDHLPDIKVTTMHLHEAVTHDDRRIDRGNTATFPATFFVAVEMVSWQRRCTGEVAYGLVEGKTS